MSQVRGAGVSAEVMDGANPDTRGRVPRASPAPPPAGLPGALRREYVRRRRSACGPDLPRWCRHGTPVCRSPAGPARPGRRRATARRGGFLASRGARRGTREPGAARVPAHGDRDRAGRPAGAHRRGRDHDPRPPDRPRPLPERHARLRPRRGRAPDGRPDQPHGLAGRLDRVHGQRGRADARRQDRLGDRGRGARAPRPSTPPRGERADRSSSTRAATSSCGTWS